MKRIRTIAFMFVPIPSEWMAPATVAAGDLVKSTTKMNSRA
jgi:hypothetical protein